MTVHTVPLPGCTPEPLMSYLKSLGVLRLLTEHADNNARGCWQGEEFALFSKLDADELVKFFLDCYEPTPILAPWNGDGGFLEETGSAVETLNQIRASKDVRLRRLRDVIDRTEQLTALQNLRHYRAERKKCEDQFNNQFGSNWRKTWKNRASADERQQYKKLTDEERDAKNHLIYRLRSEFAEESLAWLDVCLLIDEMGFVAAPVLGSGGCDGRMEFSANFLANVLSVLENEDKGVRLRKALFDEGEAQLLNTSIGQFAPGLVGGANQTQGFIAAPLLNPWDYVFMIEGIVLLAGAVSRKLSMNRQGRAGFPFTVLPPAVGDRAMTATEARQSRGELWLPMWNQPAGLEEIRAVFSEGRAEWGGRQSRSALDFSRAVAALGTDRGIRSFTRYGFLKRNGLAYMAAPLGRFDVQGREYIDLLREIDPWLDRYRNACDEKTPPRFTTVLRRIETAIFDFCRYGGSATFSEILCALGQAESQLAKNEGWRSEKRLQPLSGLSPEWISAANDDTSEFELALALAGIEDPQHKVASLRANLEPIHMSRNEGSFSARWAERDRTVVWSSANLDTNLAAVLERRLLEGERVGCDNLPLAFRYATEITDIAAFLSRSVADTRITELLWGLVLIDQEKPSSKLQFAKRDYAFPIPRAYALLKLLFLPQRLVIESTPDLQQIVRFARRDEQGIRIVPESCVLPLLRAGRLEEACAIAVRRLRASGLAPFTIRWAELGGTDGIRLAGALLFPIPEARLGELLHQATRT